MWWGWVLLRQFAGGDRIFILSTLFLLSLLSSSCTAALINKDNGRPQSSADQDVTIPRQIMKPRLSSYKLSYKNETLDLLPATDPNNYLELCSMEKSRSDCFVLLVLWGDLLV